MRAHALRLLERPFCALEIGLLALILEVKRRICFFTKSRVRESDGFVYYHQVVLNVVFNYNVSLMELCHYNLSALL